MANKVYVAGVGMTKFLKPRGLVDYPELGIEAGTKALIDAGIKYDEVQQGVAAYCYGDSTSGQRVFYSLGMSQIPLYNVNNNCSTGSTALFLGKQLIEGGLSDVILCIGFEKMEPGSLKAKWTDRENPLAPSLKQMKEIRGLANTPLACQQFANAGSEYMQYGAKAEDFGKIAEINHRHSKHNPYSQFQDEYTLEQIMASPTVHGPMTKLQCCPTSDGAAAVVLVSEKYLKSRPDLADQAIEIAGQAMCTDSPKLYSKSSIEGVGADMTRRAAKTAMGQAGITPNDVQVVELHDCFSANELVCLDLLGLSEPNKAHELVRRGDITFGGKYVVNPSGGLISKGHPLGATGMAQCAELTWQLRGWATNRAVPHCKVALQHNVGLGGAVVVTVYKRADGREAPHDPAVAPNSGRGRIGYNPAVEAREITKDDVKSIRAPGSSIYSDYQLDSEKFGSASQQLAKATSSTQARL